ncbi:hypothetical protein OY671_008416, partial [Metschnikowia pulcherrima]
AGGLAMTALDRTDDFISAAVLAAAGRGVVLAPASLQHLALDGLTFRPSADHAATVESASSCRDDTPAAARGVIDEAAKPAFRGFVDKLYAPQLEAMGFDPRAGAHAGDDPDKAQRRVASVATSSDTARDPASRARLAAAAEALLGGNKAALDPAFYGSGMRAWSGQAKSAGAQKSADIALGSEDPVFRPSASRAVAASGDAETARWVLDGFKDARSRPSERLSMIAGISVTPETREIGYIWLKAHLEEMLSGSGGIFLAARLPGTSAGFCSVDQAKEFEA